MRLLDGKEVEEVSGAGWKKVETLTREQLENHYSRLFDEATIAEGMYKPGNKGRGPRILARIYALAAEICKRNLLDPL